MKHPRYVQGFNFVEVMVVLVILAILLGLGLSYYSVFIANQKVRSSAEVFVSTVLMARAEAVKRNSRVTILRTDADPLIANVDTATDSATALNILVRAGTAAPFTFVEGRSGRESSGASLVISGPSSITFNSFGMVVDSTPAFVATDRFADFDFSNPTAGSCVADGGQVRCLRVRLSRGGQARLCDPAVANDDNDTRFCGV